jgi:hypothetical protein
MKNEVLGSMKSLGNMILGKFGMNLDSFKLNQKMVHIILIIIIIDNLNI